MSNVTQLKIKSIITLVTIIMSFNSTIAQEYDIDSGITEANVVKKLFPDGNTSIAKGNMFISATFGLSHSQGENETTLLQTYDDSYRLNWFVTLRSGYFIKDNFALGGYFKYANDLDQTHYSNDNGSVNDNRLEREYSIAPFMRNFLPLGNGTFCLFNETNLEFTYGSSLRQVENSEDVTRTSGKSYQLKLGIQPGISAWVTKGVAVEVGTSLLGLSSKYTTEIVNDDESNESYTYSNEVSFKIDLLSLFLGINFYIPVK